MLGFLYCFLGGDWEASNSVKILLRDGNTYVFFFRGTSPSFSEFLVLTNLSVDSVIF
jgi:hypothetical protein